MLFAALLMTPRPGLAVCAVCLAYGLMQTGVVLVNTAEDFPEDRQMGVRTVIVALGLRRGIGLGLGLAVVGMAGLLAVYAGLFAARAKPPAAFAALLPLAVTAAAVAVSMARVYGEVRAPEAEAVAAVKREARWVPLWISTLAVSSLLAAAALFVASG
jgi:1,4-dihydroxy-2-naphthoate octaprenyltransferase